MMVIAVLINNAGHLCIDADTVADTITKIAKVHPELVGNVAAVAILLDPDNTNKYTDSAKPVPPGSQVTKPSVQPDDPPINNEIPPGGGIGTPPSPE
jgi:hypothetical protein